jgi:hypothetical protein
MALWGFAAKEGHARRALGARWQRVGEGIVFAAAWFYC